MKNILMLLTLPIALVAGILISMGIAILFVGDSMLFYACMGMGKLYELVGYPDVALGWIDIYTQRRVNRHGGEDDHDS